MQMSMSSVPICACLPDQSFHVSLRRFVEKETSFYRVFLVFWMITFGEQQCEPLRMKVNINPGTGVDTLLPASLAVRGKRIKFS